MRQRMGRANEAGAIRTAMARASSRGQPAPARAGSGDNVSHGHACNKTATEPAGWSLAQPLSQWDLDLPQRAWSLARDTR
jgi:hypothetical protein